MAAEEQNPVPTQQGMITAYVENLKPETAHN